MARLHALRLRRPGMVVALLGPDGAGKTTLAEALMREVPLRARRVYMGTNPTAGDALSLRRGVVRRRAAVGDGRLEGMALKLVDSILHLAEERYRHLLALQHRARGGIVVLDRCALDLIVNARLARARARSLGWLRFWLLHAGEPHPDLVLVLDAPGEVLHARKGEHDPCRLERMRRAYAALERERPDVMLIDARQGAEDVSRTVISLLWSRLAKESGRPATT